MKFILSCLIGVLIGLFIWFKFLRTVCTCAIEKKKIGECEHCQIIAGNRKLKCYDGQQNNIEESVEQARNTIRISTLSKDDKFMVIKYSNKGDLIYDWEILNEIASRNPSHSNIIFDLFNKENQLANTYPPHSNWWKWFRIIVLLLFIILTAIKIWKEDFQL